MLTNLSLLPFHINLRIILLIIYKIAFWMFSWDCVESIDQVGKVCHLNNIESYNQYRISLHLLRCSLISFLRIMYFSIYRFCIFYVKLMPKYFRFCSMLIKIILTSNSRISLLATLWSNLWDIIIYYLMFCDFTVLFY